MAAWQHSDSAGTLDVGVSLPRVSIGDEAGNVAAVRDSRTYRRPGDYRVTVTAWDTLGQAGKTSKTVRVLGQATPQDRT